MKTDNIIKAVTLKGENTRISIILKYSELSNQHYYLVITRKLTDFKNRQINKTESIFSVSTFSALFSVGVSEFVENPLISNKVLNREIAMIKPFKAERYFTEELR